MAALSAPRAIVQYGNTNSEPLRAAGVSGDAIVYHGAMVGKAADGYIVPASTSIRPIGVADLEAYDYNQLTGQAAAAHTNAGIKLDATGLADNTLKLVVRQGVFKMKNKSGDLLTAASIGGLAYVEDDQTVRATSAGTVVAGILIGFADDGLPLVQLSCQLAAIA